MWRSSCNAPRRAFLRPVQGSFPITGHNFIAKDQGIHPHFGHDTCAEIAVCPRSNGKFERLIQTIKGDCSRPVFPLSLDDARRMVEGFIHHYNNIRLRSAIGYLAQLNSTNARDQEIFEEQEPGNWKDQ